MATERRYWLMKSEPDVYSIDDLKRDGQTYWEGVRNYQARNLMRDEMKVGDGVLYYHSRVKPMGSMALRRWYGRLIPITPHLMHRKNITTRKVTRKSHLVYG